MPCLLRRCSHHFFFLMIRRPPRSTQSRSSAASDVYKRQHEYFKEVRKCFTEHGNPGQGYRHLHQQMKQALEWPADTHPDPRLCHDGKRHFIVPAFFHTISELSRRGREFTLVIRTYGTDMQDILSALNAYAQGKHVFEAVHQVGIGEEHVWRGRYNPTDGSFGLHPTTQAQEGIITDENRVIEVIQATEDGPIAARAVQDDYRWWRDCGYTPSAGKPMWLTHSDHNCHHIFFDDNIHNIPSDSIVAVRARQTSSCQFVPLGGEETIALHGVHLVGGPTIEPILNRNYFLEKIDACEAARTNAAQAQA
eukprot:TRINITY_DN3901_c0_g1_i1.p1 TRINITY_DN3901_c0_g1~~TRINITY_DN3901_c0_g1_i1.p1  ORF type:complete len:308 (+),score=63.24 TRINITY_DN3901_c0_g1_i1:64-987(+)